MKFVTVQSGELVHLDQWQRSAAGRRIFTGLDVLDGLLASFTRASVSELLHGVHSAQPMLPALLLAQAALGSEKPPCAAPGLSLRPDLSSLPPIEDGKSTIENPRGVIVISDPKKRLYPPAVTQLGIPLSRLYLLHPKNREEELWAIGECLGSSGVSAVVACVGRLTQLEARRLQLSAERADVAGVLIRPAGQVSSTYAANLRLLVEPSPASAASQRWKIQLLHGTGGQIGESVILEYNREEHTVRASTELADHTSAQEKKAGRASVA